MKLKRLSVVSTVALSISPFYLSATTLDIPSSFNPVGSGARALGLGGSFIAVADDATASSWNPAGLIQLRKPEVAAVLSSTRRAEDVALDLTGDNADNASNSTDLNFFAISIPCSAQTCGKNMVFSVNYQRQYDLSREWDLEINDPTRNTVTQQNYQQEGALYALGLSFAVQVSPKLNLGMTLNYWGDALGDNELIRDNKSREIENSPGDFFSETDIRVKSEFSGVNVNLGLTWIPYQKGQQKLTIGAVYKSEFDADFDTNTQFSSVSGNLGSPVQPTPINTEFNSETEITMPSSFGIGIAYQTSDAFTASFDLYTTDWESFAQRNIATDEVTSVISGRSIEDTTIDSSVQVRLGAEYRIISQDAGSNYIIPLRAGLFYDPVIGDGDNTDSYGISVGTGIAQDTWVFDVAYQYRWADDLGRSINQNFGSNFSLQEHQLYASAFYRF